MKLSEKSAKKLQRILSKRIGRELSETELEGAYTNLMDFAYALVDLSASENNEGVQTTKTDQKEKLFLVN